MLSLIVVEYQRKVTSSAVLYAASIAGLCLTTEVAVAEIKDKEVAIPAAIPGMY